jgi:hypothetical protein
VEHSSGQNNTAIVKDTFEIKAEHNTGHEPGLVVVLDRMLMAPPGYLTGKHAILESTLGEIHVARIDEAKEHGTVNSLFFRNLKMDAVYVGSPVRIQDVNKMKM